MRIKVIYICSWRGIKNFIKLIFWNHTFVRYFFSIIVNTCRNNIQPRLKLHLNPIKKCIICIVAWRNCFSNCNSVGKQIREIKLAREYISWRLMKYLLPVEIYCDREWISIYQSEFTSGLALSWNSETRILKFTVWRRSLGNFYIILKSTTSTEMWSVIKFTSICSGALKVGS